MPHADAGEEREAVHTGDGSIEDSVNVPAGNSTQARARPLCSTIVIEGNSFPRFDPFGTPSDLVEY